MKANDFTIQSCKVGLYYKNVGEFFLHASFLSIPLVNSKSTWEFKFRKKYLKEKDRKIQNP
jgi:hypothetical protein